MSVSHWEHLWSELIRCSCYIPASRIGFKQVYQCHGEWRTSPYKTTWHCAAPYSKTKTQLSMKKQGGWPGETLIHSTQRTSVPSSLAWLFFCVLHWDTLTPGLLGRNVRRQLSQAGTCTDWVTLSTEWAKEDVVTSSLKNLAKVWGEAQISWMETPWIRPYTCRWDLAVRNIC